MQAGVEAQQHAVSDGVVSEREAQGLQQLQTVMGTSERTVADMEKNAAVLSDLAARVPGGAKADMQANINNARINGAAAGGAAAATSAAAPTRYTQGPSIQQVDQGAPLKIGMKGESVRWMQEQLNAAGAQPPLVVDGKLGPKTEAALKEFQQSRGVKGDTAGIFAAGTREAFDRETLMDPVQWKAVHDEAIRSGRTTLGAGAEANERNRRVTHDESFTPYQGKIENGVVPMSQGDYNSPIGNSNKTIRQVGCMMTSFAMASTAITGNAQMNPAEANRRITAAGGFVGALLVPDKAAAALGMRVTGRVGTHNSSAGAMQQRLDAALAAGRPAVVGVDYRAGSGGTGNGNGVDHWMTITGKNPDGSYTAVDPAGGRPMTLRVGPNGLLEGNAPLGNKHYVAKEMVFLDRR
jgi:peptidoglycan hydrolase-like protein with peptidoglycan-binding domain